MLPDIYSTMLTSLHVYLLALCDVSSAINMIDHLCLDVFNFHYGLSGIPLLWLLAYNESNEIDHK